MSGRNDSAGAADSSSSDVDGFTAGLRSSSASGLPEYDVEPKLAEDEVVVGDPTTLWVRFGGGPNSEGSRREDRGAD